MTFWQHKPLRDLSPTEWESLCDGCGKCCCQKLEDIDTGEVVFTNIVCRFLDESTPGGCHCLVYPERSRRVPDCLTLRPESIDAINPAMMPETCAYRLLLEGQELPDWHPLLSGNADSVFQAGHSVRGRVVSEIDADEPELHLVDWLR